MPGCVLLLAMILFFLDEHVLADTANGAGPIIGDVFECCAGGDTAIRVADCRVVNVTASFAFVFCHSIFSLLKNSYLIYIISFKKSEAR